MRDKIANEGSGGVESKRDEIIDKPSSSTVFSAEKKVESNEEQTQLTGELRSKIEKSDDQADAGDKKKVCSLQMVTESLTNFWIMQ